MGFLSWLSGRTNDTDASELADLEKRVQELEATRTAWLVKMDTLCRRIDKRLVLGQDRYGERAEETDLSRREMARRFKAS